MGLREGEIDTERRHLGLEVLFPSLIPWQFLSLLLNGEITSALPPLYHFFSPVSIVLMGCGSSHRIPLVAQPAPRLSSPHKERHFPVTDPARFKLPLDVLHGLEYVLKSVDRQVEAHKKTIADASPELAKPGFISKKEAGQVESGSRGRADPGESVDSESRIEDSALRSPKSPLPPRVARSPELPGVEVFHFPLESAGPSKATESRGLGEDSLQQQRERVDAMQREANGIMSKYE